jgi:hypothetical protein
MDNKVINLEAGEVYFNAGNCAELELPIKAANKKSDTVRQSDFKKMIKLFSVICVIYHCVSSTGLRKNFFIILINIIKNKYCLSLKLFVLYEQLRNL